MDKQTGKFIARIAENLPDMSSATMQKWINNPKGLQGFLRGLCSPDEVMREDTRIIVQRFIRPSYPGWMDEALYEDLEKATGPGAYDIASVVPWLHDGQKNGGRMTGRDIHDYLKRTDALETCLGLRDLEEIQKKGVVFFRKYFKGKAVFAWKGVVRGRNGFLYVPYLYDDGAGVVLCWYWLGHVWCDGDPALCFAS